MTRKIVLGLAVVAAIGVAALYFPLDFLRPSVERALERSLGRKAEVAHVYVNLFGVPGFSFENVTIHEDPRAGIEPFAYVPSLNARIRALSLFRRRLVFSSLDLGDATINILKTADGLWNFQLFPGDANAALAPSIKVRGGRVNFKFGEVKSVFYFNDADLDITPYGNGAVELRFGGAPSRTDRSAPNFGHFFIRGNWTASPEPHLDVRVELERAPLNEMLRLIDPAGFGVQGFVTLRTQISGRPSALDIAGNLQVEDLSRWDLLPRGNGYAVPLKGTLDLAKQEIAIATVNDGSEALFGFQFRGADFLSKPDWAAGVRVQRLALANVLQIARQMGAEIPESLKSEGLVSGEVMYAQRDGISGDFQLRDASVDLPDAKPVRTPAAGISIRDGSIYLSPVTVAIGEKEAAEIEGRYSMGAPRGLDLRITTPSMNVVDLRSFGLGSIPLLEQTTQGSWRGWAHYQRGEWSGQYELQNARIAIDGLADPLRIQSGFVRLNGARVSVSRLRARAGKILFSGDYRWEPDSVRQHRFTIEIQEADASELGRLLSPALAREQGFLARTLRLAASPAPEWLKGRRADGVVSIGALRFGDVIVRLDKTRLLWDATAIRLAGVDAHLLDGDNAAGAISGDMDIALDRTAPHFKFDGRVNGVPYRGGTLDFDGTFQADGLNTELLYTMKAEGRIRGRAIALTPDAEFRTAVACFSLAGSAAGPVWKFGEIEAVQGGDTYTGSGLSQSDGKVVLDLSRGGRPVRISAALAPGQ